jgi:uncharacterized RDD family membrane protein YckC
MKTVFSEATLYLGVPFSTKYCYTGCVKHTIELPEQVDMEVDLASIGSRSLALLVDLLIGGLILFVPYALLFLTARDAAQSWLGQFGVSTITLIFLLLLFSFQWGYFNFFEWLWNGQSPGKRVMSLRVIRTNGSPISWSDVFLRNLVRPLDTFLSLGLVGVLMIFVSKRSQRLGDLMAQTLVIRESTLDWAFFDSVSPPAIHFTPDPQEAAISLPTVHWELLQSFAVRRTKIQPASIGRIALKIRTVLSPMVPAELAPDSSLNDTEWLVNLSTKVTAVNEAPLNQ